MTGACGGGLELPLCRCMHESEFRAYTSELAGRVGVAGSDGASGADVLAELRATLAATSRFEEASWGLAVTLRLQDACACCQEVMSKGYKPCMALSGDSLGRSWLCISRTSVLDVEASAQSLRLCALSVGPPPRPCMIRIRREPI